VKALGFFLAAAFALIFLMLPVSTIIWEQVPGMPYLQFPWRLLGPTNLLLAICAASGVALLPNKPWRWPAVAGALAVTILLAIPLLYPAPWSPQFGGTSPAEIIEWEQHSEALGTTSTGDFLPVTVDVIPPPMPTLIRSYTGPAPVDKVNRATIPTGAEVSVVEHGPRHDRFQVSTPQPFRLRLYTFYHPGWRAYVDGKQVDIEIARPEGFVTLEVPRGSHSVLVRFEDTLPRRVGWVISAAALAALAGIGLWGAALAALVLIGLWTPKGPGAHRLTPGRRLGSASFLWLSGVLIVVLGLKLAVIDPHDRLHYTSPAGEALPAQHKLRTSFDGQIELVGYDLPEKQVRPGATLSVVLYWRALNDVEKNYQSFVHIAQPLNVAWAQEDHLNPGGLPTTRWPLDKYVWDEYDIYVPPQTPPGEYKINVGLYLLSSGVRLKRQDGDQQRGADSIVIDSILVAGPPR
jgi:hypothetical protein